MIQEITSILNNLRRVDGVLASVILDRDGLLIASEDSTQKGSAEELASLFARAIHTFEHKTRLDNSYSSGIEQMIIERQGNEKVILAVSSLFILAVMTHGTINLGLIQIEMKDTIKLLTPLLE